MAVQIADFFPQIVGKAQRQSVNEAVVDEVEIHLQVRFVSRHHANTIGIDTQL